MEFVIRVPRYWRRKAFKYRLEGFRCDECGQFHFSPRIVCRKCRSRRLSPARLTARGKLLAHTIVRTSTPLFEQQIPYIVGLIQTEEGDMVVAQLTDCEPEELREGAIMEATFRRIRTDGESKIIQYGYKFRPVVSYSRE